MTKYQIVFTPMTYGEGGYYVIEKWKPQLVGFFRQRDIGYWDYLVSHSSLEGARELLEKLKENPYDTAEF